MKIDPNEINDELKPEYDFDYTEAVRGKYAKRLKEEGSNVVLLDPDVAEVFHDSATVNEALRTLISFMQAAQRLTKGK